MTNESVIALEETSDALPSNSLFAVRGNLDGDQTQHFSDSLAQFIGLIVGEEEFLLPISAISEIIMLRPMTYVPQSSQYIEGVFNLRGTILPSINLRRLMGLPKGEAKQATRIIILRVESHQVGVIVDGITYVIALAPNEMENQTLSGRGAGADLITSVSKRGERVRGILDVHKIMMCVAPPKVAATEE